MEVLMGQIFNNKVPTAWMKYSFETTRGLGSWLDNIKQRLEQLNAWKDAPEKEPGITFINRLYNPRSFLTAVKQVMSREKSLELNKLYIQTDIQKKIFSVVPVVLCRAVVVSDKEEKGIYICPVYKT